MNKLLDNLVVLLKANQAYELCDAINHTGHKYEQIHTMCESILCEDCCFVLDPQDETTRADTIRIIENEQRRS